MKRHLLALSAGLLISAGLLQAAGLAPAPVLGAAVIDQHSETGNYDWLMSGDFAQTFTVGKTGTLTKVALWVFTNSGTAHVDVYIHALNAAGYPTGSHLAQTWAGVGTTDDFFLFTFTPGVAVTAGQRLAIVIHMASSCNIRGSTGNPYAAGMAEDGKNGWHPLQNVTTSDFHFRTYMVLPLHPPSPTPNPTPAPTPAPAAPTIATPSVTPVATESPAGSESPSVEPSGPAATAEATATAGGAGNSGGNNDMTLPALLAGASLVAVGGGLFILLYRRRRRAAE